MATHRYWRILANTTQNAIQLAIADIAMHATIGGANLIGTGTASAVRQYTGYEAAKGFDGNAGTAWMCQLRPGLYPSGMAAAGPDTTGAPSTLDTNGDVTIQNLINAAGTNSTVTIPGGKTYILNNHITPLSGQTIQAAAGTAVTLRAASTLAAVNMFYIVGVSNLTIKNISLDGNYVNRQAQQGASGAETILFSGGGSNTIINCDISNSPSYAIWSYNVTGLTIQSCTGSENFQAVRLDGNNITTPSNILGNTFVNNGLYGSMNGVELLNCKAPNLKANKVGGFGLPAPASHGFDGTWGNSFYITATDSYLIENNDCTVQSEWSSAVLGQGCTNGTLQYNSLRRGTTGTRSFWYEQTGADQLIATLNICDGGVSVGDTGGNHLTFTFNTVTSYSDSGMDMNSSCQVATVTDNTFTCNGGVAAGSNGVYLWDKSTSAVADNVSWQRNTMNNYFKGVDINNPGGTGTVYGLTVANNTYNGCTSMVVVEGSIIVDASCTLQNSSVAQAAWNAYIEYDFGGTNLQDPAEVVLTSWNASLGPAQWLFQFSDDNATWTTKWTINDTPLAAGSTRSYTGNVAALVSTHPQRLSMKQGLSL